MYTPWSLRTIKIWLHNYVVWGVKTLYLTNRSILSQYFLRQVLHNQIIIIYIAAFSDVRNYLTSYTIRSFSLIRRLNISLPLRTCKVWHKMLSRICQSIRCQFNFQVFCRYLDSSAQLCVTCNKKRMFLI